MTEAQALARIMELVPPQEPEMRREIARILRKLHFTSWSDGHNDGMMDAC